MKTLWTKTDPLPRFEPLRGDIKTDVLIIGGGLAGVLCAYRLKEAGVDSALVEANRIGGGVTGYTTAKITSQHGLIYDKLMRRFGEEKARLYWQANEEALFDYRRLSQQFPCDFEEQDAFVYTRDDEDKIERELKACQRLGIPAAFERSLPLLPIDVKGAVKFPHQAQFHPLKFLAGLLDGLTIYEQTPARAFDGRAVRCDHGSITASKIIVATHFPIFNKHGSYFLKLYQHRSYVLALKGAADVGGMYVDECNTGLSFRNHGERLLLGGGAHRTGKTGGNWNELIDFAKANYPDATVSCRWATQDCMTLDDVPYIGVYSKRTPDLYVATGFNKWGMTSSMTAASLLCRLILGKEDPYESLFSPSRRIWRPQLMINSWEAMAGLLNWKTPRCPHMGCALTWNKAEHSWDCSCHGSRFSPEGTLLNAPATEDMNC